MTIPQFFKRKIFYIPALLVVFLRIGVSAGVGLIFGIYPASQASKKSPIEALKYE